MRPRAREMPVAKIRQGRVRRQESERRRLSTSSKAKDRRSEVECRSPKAEARKPKPEARPSTPARLRGSRRIRASRSRRLFLAFHLRQAQLQGSHQVDYRSQLLRLLHFGHFPAFELGLDQLLQIFLEIVF